MTTGSTAAGSGRAGRVLFWAESFWPFIGGAEIRSARLLRELDRRGFEIRVLTSLRGADLPEEEEFHGIPVLRLPFREGLQPADPLAIHRLRKRVRSLKDAFAPDLVHLDFVGPSCLFHLLTDDRGAPPTLATVQRAPPEEPAGDGSVAERTLASSNWVTYCSEAVRQEWSKWLPELRLRDSVIENAVDASGPDPSPVSLDPPHLVCLGRLVAEKGFDLAIEAVRMLRETHPDVRLTVAGDGDRREALEDAVRHGGLSDDVHFIGWVSPDEVPELLATATVVLVPSRTEAFGLVAAEAAMAGRPVVASDVGGLAGVVEHGRTGILVEPDDAGRLAWAVRRMLEDPEATRRMGREARSAALDRFSWQVHVDDYERLYRNLMEERRDADIG